MKLVAWVDGGGCHEKRNAGIGIVLVEAETGEVLWARGFDIGQKTNNEAEYSAVLLAIYQAQEFGAQELQVYSDSKVIVNQLLGDWKIHENHLREYWEEINAVVEDSSIQFNIEWVPRNKNQVADALARSAVSETFLNRGMTKGVSVG